MDRQVTVIGGGLAGCEAAWQLAEAGFAVCSCLEMKPVQYTPAHHYERAGGAGLLQLAESRPVGNSAAGSAEGGDDPAGFAADAVRPSHRQWRPAVRWQWIGISFSDLATDAYPESPEHHPGDRHVVDRTAGYAGSAVIATGPLTDGALAADFEERQCGTAAELSSMRLRPSFQL